MIFNYEQVAKMRCYYQQKEEIEKQTNALFDQDDNLYVFVTKMTKDHPQPTRTFMPLNQKQEEVVNSKEFKAFKNQENELLNEMMPLILECKVTLQEHYQELIKDIQQYDESIFIINEPLLIHVYKMMKPRLFMIEGDVTKNILIYYLCEFYIHQDPDIETVIDAEISFDSYILLKELVNMLMNDPYIDSIIKKHLKKQRI